MKINGRSVEHEMKPVNAVSTDRGKSLFLTDDPQYLMDIPELDGGPAWLEVEYRFDILSEQEEKNEKVRFFLDLSIACDILKGVVAGRILSGSEKRVYITCLKTGNVKDRLHKF